MVIPEGEEYLAQLLWPKNNQKYILVISDLSRAPMIHCPPAPVLFSVVTQREDGPPDVAFYSREDITHG